MEPMERVIFTASSPEAALERALAAIPQWDKVAVPRVVLGSEPTRCEPTYYVVTIGSV